MTDHDEYCIVRFHFMGDSEVSEVIAIGLTRDEAEAHCNRDDTRGDGWFDGFSTHENRSGDVNAFIDACDHTGSATSDVSRGDDSVMETIHCTRCLSVLGRLGY